MITKEYLENQLKAFEQELRETMLAYHRIEGSILFTRHMLADLDKQDQEKAPEITE